VDSTLHKIMGYFIPSYYQLDLLQGLPSSNIPPIKFSYKTN
jgi:hypothetical protein